MVDFQGTNDRLSSRCASNVRYKAIDFHEGFGGVDDVRLQSRERFFATTWTLGGASHQLRCHRKCLRSAGLGPIMESGPVSGVSINIYKYYWHSTTGRLL